MLSALYWVGTSVIRPPLSLICQLVYLSSLLRLRSHKFSLPEFCHLILSLLEFHSKLARFLSPTGSRFLFHFLIPVNWPIMSLFPSLAFTDSLGLDSQCHIFFQRHWPVSNPVLRQFPVSSCVSTFPHSSAPSHERIDSSVRWPGLRCNSFCLWLLADTWVIKMSCNVYNKKDFSW